MGYQLISFKHSASSSPLEMHGRGQKRLHGECLEPDELQLEVSEDDVAIGTVLGQYDGLPLDKAFQRIRMSLQHSQNVFVNMGQNLTVSGVGPGGDAPRAWHRQHSCKKKNQKT